MLEVAILNTLRDLAIGLAAVSFLVFLLWLEVRSERKHKAQVEAQDMADFEAHAPRESADWAWPPKPVQPRAEYVAERKGRVK